MKKLFAAVLSGAMGLSLSPAMGTAQTNCPAEVAQAKDMLTKKRSLSVQGDWERVKPRGDSTAAGSTTTAQAPRADMTKPASLVKEAEAACKSGNMTLATDKAKAALGILQGLGEQLRK